MNMTDFRALACDYDGTLAHDGRVDPPTLAALQRVRRSGRKLILVSGRFLDSLQRVCERLDLFDRVVAENGALVYAPTEGRVTALGEPPPQALIDRLRARGVHDLDAGRVILATHEPHGQTARQVIQALGLPYRLIANKGALMVLPAGVDKTRGLAVALGELGVESAQVAAVGDAENDLAFLESCGYAAAVANALPQVKERADFVTRGARGAGVVELVGRLLAGDLPDPGRA